MNDAQRVHVASVALGEFPGTLLLFHHPDPSRASLAAFEDASSAESVAVVTLDDLLDGLGVGAVDFMKLDIEGAELDALQGAVRTIDRAHPLIMFEHQPEAADRMGHDARGAWDFLERRGYSFAALDEQKHLRQVDSPGQFGPNYFAVPTTEQLRHLLEAHGDPSGGPLRNCSRRSGRRGRSRLWR